MTTLSESQSGGGGNVTLFDYNGFTFQYMHCTEVYTGVKKAGEVIALSGNTGHSTGAHLHFGQKKGSEYLNPQRGYIFWAIKGNPPA